MPTYKTALHFLYVSKPGQHQSKDPHLRTTSLRLAHSQWAGTRTMRTENVLPHMGEVDEKGKGSTWHLLDWGRASILTDPTVYLAMMSLRRDERPCSFQSTDSWDSPTVCPSHIGDRRWGEAQVSCYEFLRRGNIRPHLIKSDDAHPCWVLNNC